MQFQIFNTIHEATDLIQQINFDFANEEKNWSNYADVKKHPAQELFAVPVVEGFENYFDNPVKLTPDWFEGIVE